MQYGNLDGVKVHFNPAFEGPERVEVPMIDGVLDLEKGILIKRTIETLGVGISSPKDRKNKVRDSISRSGRKTSNTLPGQGSCFKSFGNSQIPLVESTEAMVELLSS
ncbi:hypothetical protein Gohar_004457 [Gossypium harknessii]|uniref:Uncharacterized protein n=1 Tax=Gossypium harknessii TaxID=34285 RepID=A0A7J9H586_9ROSI|nr:hypothetical protein [Gossypium harknessii]